MDNNQTINEILEVVNFIKDNSATKDELAEVREVVAFLKDNAVMKDDFLDLKNEVGGLKNEVGGLKKEVIAMKAVMVTKDYLDEKLSDLRGDLVVLTRKEDTKLLALIKLLKNKKLISDSDEKQLLTMEPFAQV